MNLLGEYKLSLSNGDVVFKLTNRALYQAQIDLNKNGLIDLISGLDTMDLDTVYTLMAASSKGQVSKDDLLDEDIDIIEAAQYLAENIAVLFDSKKKKPAQRKK
jgi:maltose-binding protein MalE